MNMKMTTTKTFGTNDKTLGCTHLNIDLYRPMMTLFRRTTTSRTTTSRTNLTIELCCKSIIITFENVVKHFIFVLGIDFLFLSFYPNDFKQEKL